MSGSSGTLRPAKKSSIFNGLESIRVGRQEIRIDVCRKGENTSSMHAWLQIDSEQELAYLHNGGILPYVVRKALR